MKKLVVRNIMVVGMHHYGRRELELNGTYHVELEPNNKYDPLAVAVFNGQRKVGNLKRDSARAIGELIRENKAKSKYLLRPTDNAETKSRKIGPQQPCAVVFKCEEDDIQALREIAGKFDGVVTKVMDLPSNK